MKKEKFIDEKKKKVENVLNVKMNDEEIKEGDRLNFE